MGIKAQCIPEFLDDGSMKNISEIRKSHNEKFLAYYDEMDYVHQIPILFQQTEEARMAMLKSMANFNVGIILLHILHDKDTISNSLDIDLDVRFQAELDTDHPQIFRSFARNSGNFEFPRYYMNIPLLIESYRKLRNSPTYFLSIGTLYTRSIVDFTLFGGAVLAGTLEKTREKGSLLSEDELVKAETSVVEELVYRCFPYYIPRLQEFSK